MLSLFVLLLGSLLLVDNCYAESQCDSFNNKQVKNFDDENIKMLIGKWYVANYYDNQERFFYKDTKCLRYTYKEGKSSSYLNLTRHQGINGESTDRQIKQIINIHNNDVLYKQDTSETDILPLSVKIVDYNVDDDDINKQYVIYCACMAVEDDLKIMMALTRNFDNQCPEIKKKIEEAKKKCDIPDDNILVFNDDTCSK